MAKREDFEKEELRECLIGMFCWQANHVNELMPDGLADRVTAVLGEETVDAVLSGRRRERKARATKKARSITT